MLTYFIRNQIDPTKKEQFATYARNRGQAIPNAQLSLSFSRNEPAVAE